MPANNGNNLIIYIAVIVAIVFTVLGYVLFGVIVNKINTDAPVKEKLPQYLSACIVRYGLLTGGALFNVAVLLITGCLLNAGVAALLALLMITLRPQLQQFNTDLKVNYPDSIN